MRNTVRLRTAPALFAFDVTQQLLIIGRVIGQTRGGIRSPWNSRDSSHKLFGQDKRAWRFQYAGIYDFFDRDQNFLGCT